MAYEREHGWTSTFRGVIAASITPFDGEGGVAFDRIPAVVDFLIEKGVAGLMIGGTTGEFTTMTTDERRDNLVAFVAAADHRVPVIAHVGHVYHRESLRLAEHAAGAGASAVAAITPYFHRATPTAIGEFFRNVASVTPQLPFFVYNYPDATGNQIPFSTFTSLLDVPNLAGAKLSVATFEEVEPYLGLPDYFCIMLGNDSLIPRFIRSGGRAVVSGNAAAFPDVVSSLFAAVDLDNRHDYEAVWPQLEEVVRLGRGGAPDRLRELLKTRGIDAGSSRISTFSPHEISATDSDAALRLINELS